MNIVPQIIPPQETDVAKEQRWQEHVTHQKESGLSRVAYCRKHQLLNGWINYYGKYNNSALKPVMRQINFTLIKWSMNKFKAYRFSKAKATQFMIETFEKQPWLFAHWKQGVSGSFV